MHAYSMGGARVDFFISHAGRDRVWAEWVAWQLVEAGYTVELDVWDWAAGQNFMIQMSDALGRAERVVALFSEAYFDRSRYTTQEWVAASVHLPAITADRLLPLRIEPIGVDQVPAVLRSVISKDLFGRDETEARRVLLEAVAGPRRPDATPAFPGSGIAGAVSRLGGAGPRLPGIASRVWNVSARNASFVGRDGLLVTMRERLLSGSRATVQVLQGMAGTGKTQVAAEYAHQFAGNYDVVWWIAADRPRIDDQVAELAIQMGIVAAGTDTTMAMRALMPELRGRGGWLLIFDDAPDPSRVTPWLPGGVTGHVLITSRAGGWAEVGGKIEVGVFTHAESVAVLRSRLPQLDEEEASRLSSELGDLPLAVARAAEYLAESSESGTEHDAALAALEDLIRRRWHVRDGKLVPADLIQDETVPAAGRPEFEWMDDRVPDAERIQQGDRPDPGTDAKSRRTVMVIYGHDQEATKAIFDWLRAVGLRPYEWEQLIRQSGSASPYIGQVLEQAFRSVQAVIVLLTPDEFVTDRDSTQSTGRFQARPNVLIEAGMALATYPMRTILVTLGVQEMPSDLAGRHYVKLDNTPRSLNVLASQLENAGCDVDRSGTDWLDPSRFPNR